MLMLSGVLEHKCFLNIKKKKQQKIRSKKTFAEKRHKFSITKQTNEWQKEEIV